ncbi:MAG TPA: glucose-6-phosphate isomerase [Chloroflexi bacterium]|nr:glucose-6-phosphate isomerase [Chloroflexota bacterium]HHW84768.1 glucose-6-phosphate isomerase [Chloroflexota bacterium]
MTHLVEPTWRDVLQFAPTTATIERHAPTARRLQDVHSIFADQLACQRLLAANPLIYRVTQVEDHNGEGDIHYGLGILMPGKVGREYFMTKGHIHAWRPAAEVYIGLRGRGMMLLEDERTGECRAAPLVANSTVYVPGYTAHRTINVGDEPLVYWGVLSSAAGHDYGAVAERNFRLVVVEKDGQPVVMARTDFLAELQGAHA